MMTSSLPTWSWNRRDFRAMNTDVAVWSYGETLLPEQVEQLFRAYERSLSRFDPASDLSQLNAGVAERQAVTPTLYAALEAALWAAQATGGFYDPTLLSALQAAGYDRSFEHIVERGPFRWTTAEYNADAAGVTHRRPHDFRSIRLLPAGFNVERPVGLGIDLGGMGKGWTVDRAADLLHTQGPFLVNAGGDLYVGGRPGQAGNAERGWTITLEHPLDPTRWMARLSLSDRALATSAITKRRWTQAGRTMHHLIDPRTGRPARTDLLSVSVVAGRTVVAEVYAKVALLLGREAGLAWLERLPDVEALVYTADRRIEVTAGFPAWLDDTAAEGVLFTDAAKAA